MTRHPKHDPSLAAFVNALRATLGLDPLPTKKGG